MKKIATTGLENEFLIIDNEGRISNSAEAVLKHLKGKRVGRYVRSEASSCMIELGSSPKRTVRKTSQSFLDNLLDVITEINALGLKLFPLGTYPGKFSTRVPNKRWYRMQEIMVPGWGKVIGSIAGFHFHHNLPKGVMSPKENRLKRNLYRAKAQEIMPSQCNFLIASDPAVTTIMQSSPYFMGEFYCKDSRVALFRDLVFTDISLKGMYSELPVFGSLPQYMKTVYDVDYAARQRKRLWIRLLSKKDKELASKISEAHKMRFYWGPLRVNKVGTYELRSMDMNLPKPMFGVALLLKAALHGIEEQALEIEPSEIGIRQPFKKEGKTVYVPPRNYVAYELIKKSVSAGLESDEVYNYCKQFHNFASSFVKRKKHVTMRTVGYILDNRRTTSDILIRKYGKNMNSKKACDIALRYAEKLEKQTQGLLNLGMMLEQLQ